MLPQEKLEQALQAQPVKPLRSEQQLELAGVELKPEQELKQPPLPQAQQLATEPQLQEQPQPRRRVVERVQALEPRIAEVQALLQPRKKYY